MEFEGSHYGNNPHLAIVDAGSTRTSVSVLSRESYDVTGSFSLEAVNPVLLSDTELDSRLQPLAQNIGNMTDVAFFGAGCLPGEASERIVRCLRKCGVNGTVVVQSDIVAAGLSLFGNKEGIACIVGTGSNTSYFKNGKPVGTLPSLGFILGDEGSGSAMGKRLLRGLYRGEFSKELLQGFENETSQNFADVIENVYRRPTPNKYLARFTYFITRNIDNHQMRKLVRDEFSDLFVNLISRYADYRYLPIGFVGSVAKVFESHLRHVGSEFQCNITAVSETPMEGLVSYFKDNRL